MFKILILLFLSGLVMQTSHAKSQQAATITETKSEASATTLAEANRKINPFSGMPVQVAPGQVSELPNESKSAKQNSTLANQVQPHKETPIADTRGVSKETRLVKETQKLQVCPPEKKQLSQKTYVKKKKKSYQPVIVEEQYKQADTNPNNDCSRCLYKGNTLVKVLEITLNRNEAHVILEIFGQSYLASDNAETPIGTVKVIDEQTIEIEGILYSKVNSTMMKSRPPAGSVTIFN